MQREDAFRKAEGVKQLSPKDVGGSDGMDMPRPSRLSQDLSSSRSSPSLLTVGFGLGGASTTADWSLENGALSAEEEERRKKEEEEHHGNLL